MPQAEQSKVEDDLSTEREWLQTESLYIERERLAAEVLAGAKQEEREMADPENITPEELVALQLEVAELEKELEISERAVKRKHEDDFAKRDAEYQEKIAKLEAVKESKNQRIAELEAAFARKIAELEAQLKQKDEDSKREIAQLEAQLKQKDEDIKRETAQLEAQLK